VVVAGLRRSLFFSLLSSPRLGNLWLPSVEPFVIWFGVVYLLLMKYVLHGMLEKKVFSAGNKGW